MTTPLAIKRLQNSAKCKLWLIIQAKGGRRQHLLKITYHEGFPDIIIKKGNVLIGNLWLVCGITRNLKFVPVS